MSRPVAPLGPLDAALQIAEALDEAGVPYAIGGELAYGWWTIPRAPISP